MNKFLVAALGLFMGISLARGGTIIENNRLLLDGMVISADAPSGVKQAAAEIAHCLKQATGVTIATITESNRLPAGGYVYLGACQKNRELGIISGQWGKNNGCILADEHNLYIAGKDDPGSFSNDKVSVGTLFAAYEFLEKYLGVRWLWPGELGETIPSIGNLIIPNAAMQIRPRLLSSLWRNPPISNAGWSSEKNRIKFYHDQMLWLKHHRFSCNSEFQQGHAFTTYFKQYGKTHPEFFSLLPDGTRRSNPYDWHHGNPGGVGMCVTSRELMTEIIARWQAQAPRPLMINLNENDTSGTCVCAACLATDNAKIADKIRLEKATEKFKDKDKRWINELGSLSDRYCRFYLEVQKLANKIDPRNRLMGLIYANYSEPPSDKIKLNERIILRFCPPFMYPWTAEKIANYKKIWHGWARTRAGLMFRPNFTLDGGGFPLEYQEAFYEIFTFSAGEGMIASDMDSLTGHYSVQGPVNYVIAALNHDGNSSLAEFENDYFSAFGAARDLVKKYFDYQKQVSMKSGFASPFTDDSIEGGILCWDLFLVADALFTKEVMQKSESMLNDAHNLPGLDSLARKRVEFLQIGLKNAQLTMAAQTEFRKYEKKEINTFAQAIKKLDAFRTSIEHTNAVNVGNLRFLENRHWPDRVQLALRESASELKNWKICWDVRNVGVAAEWFKPDFAVFKTQTIETNSQWEKQPAGLAWEKEHGFSYRGVAWYYNTLENVQKEGLKNAGLYFGAVDGTATIYLNGTKIHYRSCPFNGNANSWKESFAIKIPDGLLSRKGNLLAVRVEKNEGLSGIWRPVFLTYD